LEVAITSRMLSWSSLLRCCHLDSWSHVTGLWFSIPHAKLANIFATLTPIKNISKENQ
jgi:hypothetical protein